MTLDVTLHVTDNRLDVVRRSFGRDRLEDDLVTGQESEGVGVAGEHLDNREDVLEVFGSVCRPRLLVVQVLVLKRRVDIENQVYSGLGEKGHALVVVHLRVDGVHTDGVDAQLLEHVDVTRAGVDVRQRVLTLLELGGPSGLVVDTPELRTISAHSHSRGRFGIHTKKGLPDSV